MHPLAAAQVVTLAALVAAAERAIAFWAERSRWFGLVSAAASAGLNLLGYNTVAERGILMLDHPDGVVTVVPSAEKLAVGPFILFGIAWLTLRLIRDHRRMLAALLVAFAAVTVVVVLRYTLLLALYAEYDDVLAGDAGLAALDVLTSTWITGAFLVTAGFAVDLTTGARLPEPKPDRRCPPPHSANWASVAGGASLTALASLAGFASAFTPPGPEKAGRILIDDRYCGIWEPTAPARHAVVRRLSDVQLHVAGRVAGQVVLGGREHVTGVRRRLLAGYDVLIIKTPEEPMPDAEVAAIDRFVHRGGGFAPGR